MKAEYFLQRKQWVHSESDSKPAVSVVMPIYETSRFEDLKKSVESVIGQKFHDFELIVVDDGSDSCVETMIRSFASSDSRVKYLRYSDNSGLPAIRANEGVLLAKAELLAFALNNDVWHPEMLGELHQQLSEQPRMDAVYGHLSYYVEGDAGFELLNEKYGDVEFSPRSIRVANYIPCNAFLIRKKAFLRVGLFNPHILMRRIADWDFWIRASTQLKIKHVPVHCGEMYEPRKNSLSRRCRVDIDLLYRFSTILNRQESPIRTLEDMKAYEVDKLPFTVNHCFSALDIADLVRELALYYEQEKLPFNLTQQPLYSRNDQIPLKIGIFEMAESIDPDALERISQFASYRFLSHETPFSECLKNDVILCQGWNEQEINTGHHKALRLLLQYYCVGTPSASQCFKRIAFIDPAQGPAAIEKTLLNFQKASRQVVLANLEKLCETARMLEDAFNHLEDYTEKTDLNTQSIRKFMEAFRCL